jgi:hypothetical protein
VAKRDRLARDVLTAALVERLCERAGARAQSADGVGNEAGSEAQLMRNMVAAFAMYERALTGAQDAALAVDSRVAIARPRALDPLTTGRLWNLPNAMRASGFVVEITADGDRLTLRQKRWDGIGDEFVRSCSVEEAADPCVLDRLIGDLERARAAERGHSWPGATAWRGRRRSSSG